jgi:hypothetical protein
LPATPRAIAGEQGADGEAWFDTARQLAAESIPIDTARNGHLDGITAHAQSG